jgi:hypothetical protein
LIALSIAREGIKVKQDEKRKEERGKKKEERRKVQCVLHLQQGMNQPMRVRK